nr:MAG TPA: hypothetical protein [Caudoviricetes sp.]
MSAPLAGCWWHLNAVRLDQGSLVPSISASIIRGPSCGGCDTVTRDRIPRRNNRKGRNWELIDKREEPSRS